MSQAVPVPIRLSRDMTALRPGEAFFRADGALGDDGLPRSADSRALHPHALALFFMDLTLTCTPESGGGSYEPAQHVSTSERAQDTGNRRSMSRIAPSSIRSRRRGR
ncbi:hypothetical protein SKAU_G00144320 [Synaphobranchus kaupii]|uniref:Uncharacterized protein n=1 Tax=Synaphobranchus kaupii TaxID=118154 RepID=A0A9Q1J4A4_SYNKA|nr:hypothetical protein SKAU_G00144320 [Synaphobranchus kaupii]